VNLLYGFLNKYFSDFHIQLYRLAFQILIGCSMKVALTACSGRLQRKPAPCGVATTGVSIGSRRGVL
jgi:hypothetical protein